MFGLGATHLSLISVISDFFLPYNSHAAEGFLMCCFWFWFFFSFVVVFGFVFLSLNISSAKHSKILFVKYFHLYEHTTLPNNFRSFPRNACLTFLLCSLHSTTDLQTPLLPHSLFLVLVRVKF